MKVANVLYCDKESKILIEVLDKEIWNEAVEAAAVRLSYYCNDLRIIEEIRKLKKDVKD